MMSRTMRRGSEKSLLLLTIGFALHQLSSLRVASCFVRFAVELEDEGIIYIWINGVWEAPGGVQGLCVVFMIYGLGSSYIWVRK